MEHADAEAVYDAGREACAEFLVELSARYERQIARLEARVERLEERPARELAQLIAPAFAGSARGAPAAGARSDGPCSRRSAGSQRDDPVAEERVARVAEHWPERCSGCGHRFDEHERMITAPPHRHQLAELPEIAVEIEEHRAHRLRCPRCDEETRAVLPAEVAASAFGPCL
jgi:hypothetical protein